MHSPIALRPSSLRRWIAGLALVAGFAAATAPARADDPTTDVGGYTLTTSPSPDGSTDSYGTGSYGTGSSTDSYGTGSTTDSYGTGSSTDSYGTG